jgi:hypothetical protein
MSESPHPPHVDADVVNTPITAPIRQISHKATGDYGRSVASATRLLYHQSIPSKNRGE